MPDKAKWSAGHNTQAHGVHHLHVPMLTHRTHNPQPHSIARKEQRKHHGGEDRNERTAEKNNFERGCDKNGSVKKHEATQVRLVNLGLGARYQLLLMPAGHEKLENAPY